MSVGRFMWVVVALICLFVSGPTLVAVASGFTTGKTIAFPPDGFTLHWYGELLRSSELLRPMLHSLFVGIESVAIGVLVGVPAVLALHRFHIRGRAFLNAYLALGFSAPLIVSGVGLLLLFTQLRVLNSMLAIGFAITIVNLPFMLWAVAAAVVDHNPELEEAAATMGAEEVQQFLFVTLPSLASGIVTGALLMFVMGITEFLVSLLLVSTDTMTLPVYLFASIRGTISPILAAVAGVYVLIAVVVFWLVMRLAGAERFLFRDRA